MQFRVDRIWPMVIAVALSPSFAFAQQAKTAVKASEFEVHYNNALPQDDAVQMLNQLLRRIEPEKIVAETLDWPVEKIEVVPHIYWREPKWVDWVQKSEKTPGAKKSGGPDGKLLLSAYLSRPDAVRVELGPIPAETPAEYKKFNEAFDKILERISAKIVREAPEFSFEFIRQQRHEALDRFEQRLHEVNAQLAALSHQLPQEDGLSPTQLAERLADLERQTMATKLSLDVLKARDEATRNQIERLKTLGAAKADDNQTLRTLSRIVELRKERLQGVKGLYEKGAVSREDLLKSEEDMLSAMVELDRAKAALQKSESQSQLDALTVELTKLAVDRAESEARTGFLSKMIPETQEALTVHRARDAVGDEIRSRLKGLEQRRDNLEKQRNRAEDELSVPIQPLKLSLPD